MLNLHIGGKQAHPDWKIVDVTPRPEVDFVTNASDLSQFADSSVDKIYASHVLEHFYYQLDDELNKTLAEWHRVLKPGGYLLISVPDLKTLCWLFLNPELDPLARHHLMRIMFGGQMDQYDIHRVGFDFDILGLYLYEAGFREYRQVPGFTYFDDSSNLQIMETSISLNVVARKSQESGENAAISSEYD